MDAPNPRPGQSPEEAARGPRGYGGYGAYPGYPAYGAAAPSGGPGGPMALYLNMLRERWWWVLLGILVFVSAAVVYTSTIVPEYRAAGRLRVYRLTPTIGNGNTAVDEAQIGRAHV